MSLPALGVRAQTEQGQLKLRKQYPLEHPIRYFNVDNLGAYYLITRSNELIKYDEDGQWVGNHRAQVLGDLRQVDVANPLQLLLFYPEVSTLLQLDNMLYQTNRFEISGLQLSDNSLVCRSFDNNFWLYDERSFRLRKLAFDLRTVVEGEWLQNEFDTSLEPAYMLEHEECIYLSDPDAGIHVFDLYGRFLKTLPVTGVERFSIFEQHLYYVQGGKAYRYHLRQFTTEKLLLPTGLKIKMVRVNQRGIYVLDARSLQLFEHSAP